MLPSVTDCRLGPRFSLKSVFFLSNTEEFTPHRPSRMSYQTRHCVSHCVWCVRRFSVVRGKDAEPRDPREDPRLSRERSPPCIGHMRRIWPYWRCTWHRPTAMPTTTNLLHFQHGRTHATCETTMPLSLPRTPGSPPEPLSLLLFGLERVTAKTGSLYILFWPMTRRPRTARRSRGPSGCTPGDFLSRGGTPRSLQETPGLDRKAGTE